jgi:hypothetical protein
MSDAPIMDGMNPTREVFGRTVCKCQRCPHVWLAENESPKRCPNCKSMLWDTPRKQKRGPIPGNPSRPRKDAKRGPKVKAKGQPKRGR